ncbi:intracellular exo-alpha-(1-_5)-L-arabinofuranosidase [bacterium BMS3Abin06]|nr:intracellular exo-alpha-(1->5)-L-arabinofuranosidase [bacterium BMS3Abin06]
MIGKNNVLVLFVAILLIFCSELAYGEQNIITIFYDRDIGQINKLVFGNSFLGFDACSKHKDGKCPWAPNYIRQDYGAGVWNPKRNESVKKVIALAKEAGLTIIRFPGGCGNHHYDWKKAIGKKRKHFLFGIDEFFKTVEEIGAEAVIPVSYFTGNAQDAADLVEYLNAPFDGDHPWAERRAKNGHPEPYGVRYFEFGNEVMHGDHRKIKKVYPEEYMKRYLNYQKAMKKIDPTIKLGAVFFERTYWNNKLIKGIGDNVDFVILHIYPPYGKNKHLSKTLSPENLFEVALALPIIDDEMFFRDILKLIAEKTGRTDVRFAITEYNGGFVQDEPVPYRYTLGTALINAELLKIFMKPEHKVLMANHFNFIYDYFGMLKIAGNFMKDDYGKPMNYIKRPNFLVYELYNKHFGDILVKTKITGDTYGIDGYELYMNDYNKRIQRIRYAVIKNNNLLSDKWEIKTVSGVYANGKKGVLEIDFHNFVTNYYHSKKTANIEPNTYYKLSGYIKTDGLNDKEGVSLEIIDSRGWQETRSAAMTNKITGTTDWEYVDVAYKTLADAKFVNVVARRIGKKRSLRGKAFFKDVRLEKFILPDIHLPYLSVNASVSNDRNKLYLMVINKNMYEAQTSIIEFKGFPLSVESMATLGGDALRAEAWILNGPSVSATNEKKKDNVKITHKQIEIDKNYFKFSFEPHSLTAIEISNR